MNEFNTYVPSDILSEIQNERKYASKLFAAMFLSWFMGMIAVLVMQIALTIIAPEMLDNQWITVSINSIYTILAVGIFALVSPKYNRAKHPVTAKMTFSAAVRYFMIAFAIMTVGSIIGVITSEILKLVTISDMENYLDEYVDSLGYIPIIISTIIVAPVFEELLFRKLLIDSISRYGTAFSVVVSGFLFGIFHGNFYQFFYAFGLGALLAYIYCIYGKLSYTIVFHALINLCGGFIPVIFEDLSDITFMMIYNIIYYILAIIGLVFLIADIRWFKYYFVQGQMVSPFKILFNAGFIALMVFGILMFGLCML